MLEYWQLYTVYIYIYIYTVDSSHTVVAGTMDISTQLRQ